MPREIKRDGEMEQPQDSRVTEIFNYLTHRLKESFPEVFGKGEEFVEKASSADESASKDDILDS